MKHSSSIFLSFTVLALVTIAFPTSSRAAVSCTILTADLGSGSSDTGSSQGVLALQRFLSASGHLSATPNGYFGPATLAGVRVFQSGQGISATGFVGPLTRTAIQRVSCSNTTTAVTSTVPTTSNTGTIIPDVSSTIFTAPKSGESLALGSGYRISWNAPSKGSYSLVLDNASGTARGIVTYYAPDNGKHAWDVGSVSVASSDQKEFVEPGTYRLRLQSTTAGPTSSDQKSRWFEIAALPASIKSTMPSSVAADGKSAVVMYGSGFTEGSSLYLVDSYKKWMNVLYTSSDATVLVFAVPADVTPGTYSLIVKDRYGVSSTGPTLTIRKAQ